MPSDMEEAHRSVLATIGQIRESSELSARDRYAAQPVAAGLRDAKTTNTRRACGAVWQRFEEWASAAGHQSLPVEPPAVALYLSRLEADGRPWPPLSRPALPSPTPMPQRGWQSRQSRPASGRGRGGHGLAKSGRSTQAGRLVDRRCPGLRP